jgi:hypothetical protein
MVIKNTVQTQWGHYTLVVLCVTFLLLAAIITADQILKAVHIIRPGITTITQEKDTSEEGVAKVVTEVKVEPTPGKAVGEEGG